MVADFWWCIELLRWDIGEVLDFRRSLSRVPLKYGFLSVRFVECLAFVSGLLTH